MSSKHYLPSRGCGSYLKRLQLEYARTDHSRLHDIITSARVKVIEETSYDNWNGGSYEHDVILFLPAETIGEFGFDEQNQLGRMLLDDLNKCTGSVNDERFRTVHLELAERFESRISARGELRSADRKQIPTRCPFGHQAISDFSFPIETLTRPRQESSLMLS